MFKVSTFAVLVVAGFTLAGSVAPVSAASAVTTAFIDDVTPNVDLLDRSSRLALNNSQDAHIRAFARAEATEQTLTANDFYDWSQADARRVLVATNGSVSEDGVITGRSVAIDKPVIAVPEQMPSSNQEDVDRLYGLTGKEFDQAYKAVQVTALKGLVVSYQEYITNSDEPALKAIATRELTKINRRLVELDRL